jgi:dipeptidyl aminopeptidase/acylaminoacyl peptidase
MARGVRSGILIVALLACAGATPAVVPSRADAAPPPVEDFFRKPEYGNAVLSPSGRFLAVATRMGEHRGVGIIDLETREVAQTIGAGDGDVLGIVWQTEERLIAFLGDLQRVAGEPPRESSVVALNRDGSEIRLLARYSGRNVTRSSFERPWTVNIVRVVPGTNDVLVTASDRSQRSLDLYRLDTKTGAKTLLTFDSPGNVGHWVVDFDGIPRAAVTHDVDRDSSAWFVRQRGSDRWTRIEEAKLGQLASVPLQFDPDGRILYVAARRGGADRAAIHEFDVETGAFRNPIIRHPERDMQAGNVRFVADYRARKLLGVRYADDRPGAAWFDGEWARIQHGVDAALPDTVNFIQRSDNGARWIVVASSDRNPGDAFLLDGRTLRMEKLFSYVPWIDPRAMTPTRWIRYDARDGLTIPALLTVPAGANRKPVPLIVKIHGGPNVEASNWEYDPVTQFFASRGYAVIEPQFRGTGGFGWKLLSSGYRKWGEEMQDDLEDGVKWAVAQGIADGSRVCFFGSSYGGYAAIWEAIRNAPLIRCSVALAAVTSIDYLFDNALSDQAIVADRSTLMRVRIGDPKTDRARFRRVNPLDNADKAGVPLLLAYGGSDRRVPLAHGTDFRAALDKWHKEYEWVEYSSEGHGLNRDEHAFDFFHRVERFLAKYLDAGAAAPPTPALPAR